MNFESLIQAVGKNKFNDLPQISTSFNELGLELESIQSGKDPLAPHGEVFRVVDNASEGAIAILKISAANSAPKMRKDLRLSHKHNVPVPETHIFPVTHNASLIIQQIIEGKSFDSMTDIQYHFLLETLPQLRKQILALMSVFCRTFPSPRKPLSRYPDPSGNRAEGYIMRKWMNLFVTPGENVPEIRSQRLMDVLERISPKSCLVDTGWALHETTQTAYTNLGIQTYDPQGMYLQRIRRDFAYLRQIQAGRIYDGRRFRDVGEGKLDYLSPTHIATFALPSKYAEKMVLDGEGNIHIFRPRNREVPQIDIRQLHYLGIIEKHGSHALRIPAEYSHQIPVEILMREVVESDSLGELFGNLHPSSGLTLDEFMWEQYGQLPTNVTHFVLKIRPEKFDFLRG